ncbi:MAG: hypothetical protein M1828_004326 [Chrysothrix sp. TS-e1954]|nr:MAG: hypothetical protein M1828_004326 [Chrysothrix sp. TS-e1954]
MANNTVIVGAGIIGLSTAYYLSGSGNTAPQSIHLVESASSLFASASGYAGGFLAEDWFSTAVAPLGALSFRLHKELAEQHDGRTRWGYSRSTGTSLSDGRGSARGDDWLRDGGSRAEVTGKHEFWEGQGPAWLTKRKGQNMEIISEDGSTAQVDPRRLCEFLLSEVKARGVHLHHPAKALSLSKDMRDELASIRVSEDNGEELDIPCVRLVLTAGAWTAQVFKTLFPSSKKTIPISSLAGHSLVVRSPRWSAEHEEKGCHAVFTSDSGFSPEIFSRMGGEIYVAGLNAPGLPLPASAEDAKVDDQAVEKLKEVATRMLGVPGEEDDLEVLRKGLCFRPVTSRGPPVVCRISDKNLDGMRTRTGDGGGLFIAAGHGPWGISQSLGTGKVMAELIEDRPTSANIRGLAI